MICDIIYQVTKGRDYNVADAIVHSDNGVSYIISDKMLDSINSQISTAFNQNFVLKKIFSSEAFDDYDYIISDNKTAIDILTLNALNISDHVIIPVINLEKTGTIHVQKRTEGNLNISGITFILSGTSDSGRAIEITAVTNENGEVTFENVPVVVSEKILFLISAYNKYIDFLAKIMYNIFS